MCAQKFLHTDEKVHIYVRHIWEKKSDRKRENILKTVPSIAKNACHQHCPTLGSPAASHERMKNNGCLSWLDTGERLHLHLCPQLSSPDPSWSLLLYLPSLNPLPNLRWRTNPNLQTTVIRINKSFLKRALSQLPFWYICLNPRDSRGFYTA